MSNNLRDDDLEDAEGDGPANNEAGSFPSAADVDLSRLDIRNGFISVHSSVRSNTSSPAISHQALLRQQAHSVAPVRPASAGRISSSASISVSNNSSNHIPTVGRNYINPILDDINTDRAIPPPEQSTSLESPQSSAANGWSIVETNGGTPPSARSLHAAAILNGIMYVFGGYDGLQRVNTFHAFSFAEKRWSPVLPSANSANPPSPRDRHVAVAFGNSFYVHGGFDGTSRVSDFWGFDFSSMTWREVIVLSGRPPSPRHSHAAVVHRNSFYIFGGYDGSYK